MAKLPAAVIDLLGGVHSLVPHKLPIDLENLLQLKKSDPAAQSPP